MLLILTLFSRFFCACSEGSKSGDAYYHSVQNHLSSKIYTKYNKFKNRKFNRPVFTTIIFPVFFCVGVKPVSHIKGGTYAEDVQE